MKAVTHRHDADTELARLVDRHGHRLAAGQMAECVAGVENDGTVTLRDNRRGFRV